METNEVKYTRHIYHKGTGNEYNLIKNSLERPILPPVVRIEPTKGHNNAKGFKEWLCVYDVPQWEYNNRVTELRATNSRNIFEGYLINPAIATPTPGSLIFFEFSRNRELLVIDVFKDYYTENPFAFTLLLESHQFLLRKKPGTT